LSRQDISVVTLLGITLITAARMEVAFKRGTTSMINCNTEEVLIRTLIFTRLLGEAGDRKRIAVQSKNLNFSSIVGKIILNSKRWSTKLQSKVRNAWTVILRWWIQRTEKGSLKSQIGKESLRGSTSKRRQGILTTIRMTTVNKEEIFLTMSMKETMTQDSRVEVGSVKWSSSKIIHLVVVIIIGMNMRIGAMISIPELVIPIKDNVVLKLYRPVLIEIHREGISLALVGEVVADAVTHVILNIMIHIRREEVTTKNLLLWCL
jgi:hypothetical protein